MAEKYLRPSFFIIGERKCGTSSLYRYLLDHPRILPCKIKEPQFFSRSLLHRLLNYKAYRALFPPIEGSAPVHLQWFRWRADGNLATEELTFSRPPGRVVTGEASANTFSQVPPGRLLKAMPAGLFILMLRDPVERAFSHYRMYQRFRQEGRKLPFRLIDFTSDVQREISAIQRGGKSYFVAPGMYDIRLREWSEACGDQLIILRSEDLARTSKAAAIMDGLIKRLDLEPHDFNKVLQDQHNVSGSATIPDEARARLRSFYDPHIQAVEALLDRQMHWDD